MVKRQGVKRQGVKRQGVKRQSVKRQSVKRQSGSKRQSGGKRQSGENCEAALFPPYPPGAPQKKPQKRACQAPFPRLTSPLFLKSRRANERRGGRNLCGPPQPQIRII